MTVKELRQKLFDIEDQNAKVLFDIEYRRCFGLELKNNERPAVIVFAAPVDLFQDEEVPHD